MSLCFLPPTANFYLRNDLNGQRPVLAVVAHQDDVEIMGVPHTCDGRPIVAVVLTSGANSPRTGEYANVTPEEMAQIRLEEQKRAADLGNYACVIQLGYDSAAIKGLAPEATHVVEQILNYFNPEVLWTHHPFDKHPTHVASFTMVHRAIQSLTSANRPLPTKWLGGEVWGEIGSIHPDYLQFREILDGEQAQRRLIEVFASQIQGGKNYVDGTLGRRRSAATFRDSHGVDTCKFALLAVILDELLVDPTLDPAQWLCGVMTHSANLMAARVPV
ncbi:PIG-L family deacetylase [bacterium]|nr:PIG-L family deacetylase [bacterium]